MGRRATSRSERELDDLALPSQRLVEAALMGEVEVVEESLAAAEDGASRGIVVDVNYIGTVSLRVKCAEVLLGEERADEVRIGYEEFRTDVSALFAAAHSGHVEVVRKLLSAGADVNQEFFRGYAITAAAREGHCNILGMLLKAGVSQSACEDALLEASLCSEAEAVQLLIHSEMIRPDAASQALVTASSRGFLHVVAALAESGVNINCLNRVLLRSFKPTLHANVDCTPLAAAIVGKHTSIVQYLLETGASTACLIQVGAWSWDPFSGEEEVRVGVCLGESYNAVWCAVEFYESSGEILKLLLRHCPSLLEDPHLGRTLLCHAILCQNFNAIRVLLDLGANSEFPLSTKHHESYPIHLAARLGNIHILKLLISHGCDVDTRTSTGETPLMISARVDHAECFLELIVAGADLGLIRHSGDGAVELAMRSAFSSSIVDLLSRALSNGATIRSSNLRVFSPLHFIASRGRAEALQMMILNSSAGELNKLDGSGLTPVMLAATGGHLEAFRLLVMAGADVAVRSTDGKSLISMIEYESSLKDCLEKVLLDGVLGNVISNHTHFRALHFAARKGDCSSTVQLLKMGGYRVDCLDENGYSPLMLAAMEGHYDVCKILLVHGSAESGLINDRNDTALSLARGSSRSNKETEDLLLDHVARSRVLVGEELCKHIREGRGNPHMKWVRMLKSGVLSWGKTGRRNVVCKEAAAGGSLKFLKNGGGQNKMEEIFRVVTVKGREVHFEASCAFGMELWVRGINIITKEAASCVT